MRLAWLPVVMVLLAGCSTQPAGNGSWTPPADLGPVDRSRACLAAQRSQVRILAFGMQRVVVRVLKHPDEPQQEQATRVRRIVHSTERSLHRRCDDHTDLAPLLDVVDHRVGDARGALDAATLRVVVDTFEAWGRAVGAGDRATVLYHRNPCVPFRRGVDVAVDVERDPTAGTATVVLSVSNDLGQRIYVEHGGRIRVDGLAPGGGSRVLDWGGSSSDTAGARAGRTSRSEAWPAGLPDVEIPVLPGASLDVFDVYALGYSRVTCRVDVDVSRAS